MQSSEDSSDLHSFYNYFVSFSRKKLEEILKGKPLEEKAILQSNLNICIKNYAIVTEVAERLLSLRKNSKMLSNIKIEYKYHNQSTIEKAYFNSIDYVDRLYHGIRKDFMDALKLENSTQSFCFAEEDFNYMVESFMSNYSETVNEEYVPVLKIII
ncbi:hypothetical protein M1585_03465 [Candidatus Parvarchaeota archaeon]|nr:hypothetical protein [Candidatus Parvarchaeota archaeon]